MKINAIAVATVGLLAFAAMPAAAQSWDELVAKAKQEGTVTVYSTLPDNLMTKAAQLFNDAYGIRLEYQRLIGNELATRFNAEADAGRIVADVSLITSNPEKTADDWVGKGWGQYLEDSGLPVVADGKLPAAYYDGKTSAVAYYPMGIAYNTQTVAGADLPESWEDIADPKWKDELLFIDPSTSAAYVPLYTLLKEDLGEDWFEKLRANEPRFFAGGAPVSQALAAGEGKLWPVAVTTTIAGLIDQGAPVAIYLVPPVVGIETHLVLTAPDRAPHPNAGRLFAQWVLSEEGNKAFTDIPGVYSIYSQIPGEYRSPNTITAISPDEAGRLLGSKQ